MQFYLVVVVGVVMPSVSLASPPSRLTGTFEVQRYGGELAAKGELSLSFTSLPLVSKGYTWGARRYVSGYGVPAQWVCYTDVRFSEFGVAHLKGIVSDNESGPLVHDSATIHGTFTIEVATGLPAESAPTPDCRPHRGPVMDSVLRAGFSKDLSFTDEVPSGVSISFRLQKVYTIISYLAQRGELTSVESTMPLAARVSFADGGYTLERVDLEGAFDLPGGGHSESGVTSVGFATTLPDGSRSLLFGKMSTRKDSL
jgi:hypothetical protein